MIFLVGWLLGDAGGPAGGGIYYLEERKKERKDNYLVLDVAEYMCVDGGVC